MESPLFQVGEEGSILFSFSGNPLTGTTVGHCFCPGSGRIYTVKADGYLSRFKALRSAQTKYETRLHPDALSLDEVVSYLRNR